MHLQLDLFLEHSAAVRTLELFRLFGSTSTGPDLLGRSDALFTAFAASHLFEGDELVAVGTDASEVVPTELLNLLGVVEVDIVDIVHFLQVVLKVWDLFEQLEAVLAQQA